MAFLKSILLSVVMNMIMWQNISSFSISKTTGLLRHSNVYDISKQSSFTSLASSKNENTARLVIDPEIVTPRKQKTIVSNLRKFMLPALLAISIPLFGFQSVAHATTLQESFATLSKTANDSGFLQSFLLIFVSEIGDKTFFIAGLLAAKYGKALSFFGSISALAVMTVISTVMGQIFHAVPASITHGIPFDDYIAVAAFSYFGLKTLYDASKLAVDDNSGIEEEKEEAEKSVSEITKRDNLIALFFQIFSLVFAAEIGDRSFLSTIALSAALNPYAVGVGAIAAHASATGVAVIGGELLSKYLSEKVIGYIGGSLFIVFAITTALGIF